MYTMNNYITNQITDKMNKLLERHKLPYRTEKEIENYEQNYISRETELVILKLPTRKKTKQNKTKDLKTSLVNSTKYLKKN